MNKTAIKNFAIWARNKLIADISYRAGLMGITADGIHQALPQSTGQTKFYEIGTPEPYAISGEAIHQREHLADLIRRKAKDSNYQTAYKYIIEEVAYTWFNRLIAVRFMEVNDYLPSHIRVLSSDQGKIEPDLVTIPFDADLDFTRDEQQTIMEFKSENKLDELFRLLFIKQCNALNEILPALFEKTNDYTELLLNMSVIDHDGVVYHLVHDIPEEDFNVERGGQVEIIGWLYQYYISEKHEEVVDPLHGKIVRKEEIHIMKYEWIEEHLMKKAGVTMDIQEQWNWVRFHVGEKLFAAICRDDETDEPIYITLKLEPVEGEFYRKEYEDIIPGYYMNKVHWNSVKADGNVPDDVVKDLLDRAYTVVFESLSKKKQREILEEAN